MIASNAFILTEALENAEERGRKKGIEQSIERGSRIAKIEIAKEMLRGKELIDKIIRYTQLSKEEILSIKI